MKCSKSDMRKKSPVPESEGMRMTEEARGSLQGERSVMRLVWK